MILRCVRWCLRYPPSYRDLEEMMTERNLSVDHVTIRRWAQRYGPVLNQRMRCEMSPPNRVVAGREDIRESGGELDVSVSGGRFCRRDESTSCCNPSARPASGAGDAGARAARARYIQPEAPPLWSLVTSSSGRDCVTGTIYFSPTSAERLNTLAVAKARCRLLTLLRRLLLHCPIGCGSFGDRFWIE
jgi:hypothetical protein